MHDFQDKVAVVTGGGSGLGRALCRALAADGARVVVADIETEKASETVTLVREAGGTAIDQQVDVSDQTSVDALADRAYAEFGAVDLLFNNAGVFVGGWLWETTDDDWDWIVGVNVLGIAHGVRAFVPRMLAQGTEAHIVNTASEAGLISAPLSGPYCTTKFAAVGLTECLHHDLSMQAGNQIAVSVLVPGGIKTAIATSERNRPGGATKTPHTDAEELVLGALADMTAGADEPEVAAARVLAGIRAGDFYISTVDSYATLVGNHNERRLAQQPPLLQMFD